MPIFYTKNMNKVYTKRRNLVFFLKKVKKIFAKRRPEGRKNTQFRA